VGILINNEAAVAKIRKLAKRTGETLTAAVEHAVDERLARVPPKRKKKGRIDREKLAEILAYFDSLPVDDPRHPDEIIGYDEFGVPMIVIDTSAIFAILTREDERDDFVAILDRERPLISPVTYVESVMVLTARSRRLAADRVNDFLRTVGAEWAPVDTTMARAVVRAFDQFGQGRHAARLNVADCFVYALAKTRNLSLLFKGADFAKTDIVPAWQP
jgi:ribonuclease VapC